MLKLQNLSKTFNPGTPMENTVLKNLSLHVKDKDFISLLGSNGAGKSTLHHLSAGTYEADNGIILLDGQNITQEKAHKRATLLGRVQQDPRLSVSPSMTL